MSLWLSGSLALAATITLVFVLPLTVPMAPYSMDSAAYTAGFNSKVADLAAAGISCCVLVAAWRGWLGRSGPKAQTGRMSGRFVWAVIIPLLLLAGIASWAVATSHVEYFRDAGYLQQQITAVALYGRHLYTQVEFPYGPLLLYIPVTLYRLLKPLGGSVAVAYFLCLLAEHLLGMLALAYAMNRLLMRSSHRRWGFALLCAGSMVNQLGLNYTHLRFALPLALLLFAIRRSSPWMTVFLLAGADVFEFAISPEVGFAFFIACCAYGLWRWKTHRWQAVAAIALPALGAALLLSATPGYMSGLIAFGRGSFNFPLEPLPHILVFLFALLWLVPRCVGQQIMERSPDAPQLFALYGLGIGMIPSTLGRCDPLHVFFNGLTVLVLSITAVSQMSARQGKTWMICLTALVAWMQIVNLRLARIEISDVVHHRTAQLPPSIRKPLIAALRPIAPTQASILARPVDPPPLLDLNSLKSLVGDATIATPFPIAPTIQEQLQKSGHYRPDYYAYFENVLTLPAEQKKIRDFNEADWALMPRELMAPWAEIPSNIGDLQGFTFGYPERHPIYLVGALFEKNLAEHWKAVAEFGDYRLYQQLR